MNKETKTCQNCKKDFTIESEDFAFYDKIKVPPPTWCPGCRIVRRQLFRNERSLYKVDCGLCGKSTLSIYAPGKQYLVYCNDCYISDKWDPLSCGQPYDFTKPFFSQFESLMHVVPRRALYQDFSTGSEYTNMAVYMKNCYLCFGGHHYEDSQYCAQNFFLNNCTDVDFSMHSEFCHDSVHLRRCSRVYSSAYSEDCMDSWFLFSCRNCHDCFGCTNMRNASHCIFNEQYSKEEYKKKMEEFNLGSQDSLKKFKGELAKKTIQYPRKYAWVRNAAGSTGDNLEGVKECFYCFSVTESENCRYSFFVPTGAKDSYDMDHVGLGAENVYELHSGFGINRVVFGNRIYYSHDIFYSDDCYNSAYLFGCISLRKKEYCILNKQYTKEEYETLVPKIIKHMNADPYRETNGIEYRFGEFFPVSIMPFAYNETVAHEYFPLSKEDAVAGGFKWRESEGRNYKITMETSVIPDSISEVSEDVLKEVIACAHGGNCNDQCTTAFRIIPQELQFYKKAGIPLPHLCPNCRHFERLRRLNPIGLSFRSCQCAGGSSQDNVYKNTATHPHGNQPCSTEFETSYAPERPEIVYCESCYNAEVA